MSILYYDLRKRSYILIFQAENRFDEPDILKKAEKELVEIARKDEPSVLRNRSYQGMSESDWMTKVAKEINTRCPTVSKIFSMLLDCSLENPDKKLPPLCLIYGIVMFIRCRHLSRIQRINTILLTDGKASKNVRKKTLFPILSALVRKKINTLSYPFCSGDCQTIITF